MEIENMKNRNEEYNNWNKEYITGTLLGINSRVDEADNQISSLEDKEAENSESEQHKEIRIQKEEIV